MEIEILGTLETQEGGKFLAHARKGNRSFYIYYSPRDNVAVIHPWADYFLRFDPWIQMENDKSLHSEMLEKLRTAKVKDMTPERFNLPKISKLYD